MPLMSMKDLLRHASENKYAVGYFESWDFESITAVLDAAEKTNSPVIIGFNGSFVGNPARAKPENIALYGAVGKIMAQSARIPVSLLLNEADDLSMLNTAIQSGFNVVMYDGEYRPFAERIEINRDLVRFAHSHGVEVEAEVGSLPTADIANGAISSGELTDPEQAAVFVRETGIDALAVAVGNIHLLENQKTKLNFDLIRILKQKIDVPLVLHGGTGISPKEIREAISIGMCKINIGTVLKRNYINALRSYFSDFSVDETDPHEILGKGGNLDIMIRARSILTDIVADYMLLFGCCNQARLS